MRGPSAHGGPEADAAGAADRRREAPGRVAEPSLAAAAAGAPLTAGNLTTLQRLAGNRATSLAVQRRSQASRLVVQRSGGGEGGGGGIAFRGQMFSSDPTQLRTLMETLIGERGHDQATSVAYAFVQMTPKDRIDLQLRGVDMALLDSAQAALGPVVKELQQKRKDYLAEFRTEAQAAALAVMRQSRTELLKERQKYADDGTATGPPPDMEGMRVAARSLAAKRRAADKAAATARDAMEMMRSQRQAPAHPGSFVPAPIFPYFPDQALREAARTTNEAWWQQEQEYAGLRATHEAKFPALAMYAANESGDAADRLDDLPTWGLFKDTRMKANVYDDCTERIDNNDSAAGTLSGDPEKVWSLPKMIEQTLRAKQAKPFQQQWVTAEGKQIHAAAAERERMIAAIALGVSLAAGALTLGTALVPAGAAGAATLAVMAAGAQTAATGLTIAVAYRELQEYRFAAASSATDLDKAQSIAQDDPAFLWLALTLVGVVLDLAALRQAFQAARASIEAAKAARDATTLADEVARVAHVPPATAEQIAAKVAAEIETLPPPAAQSVVDALERLGSWETLAIKERRQLVTDALAGGDPMAVLARTGMNPLQLTEELGKGTKAARALWEALTRKAFAEVGPALRTPAPGIVLTDEAVANVVAGKTVGAIKGQLFEEVMQVEMRRVMEGPADDALRRKLVRGADGEGQAQFIPPEDIRTSQPRPGSTGRGRNQLSDGLIAALRKGEGRNEVVIIRVLEAKAGSSAMEDLGATSTALSKLSQADRAERLRVAAGTLRTQRPELRKFTLDRIVADHPEEVEAIAKRHLNMTETGQATRDTERLVGHDSGTSQPLPSTLWIKGEPYHVVFAGGRGRPSVTGVVPRGVDPEDMAKNVSKGDGVRLGIMNLQAIDDATLTALAQRVATAKGLPVR